MCVREAERRGETGRLKDSQRAGAWAKTDQTWRGSAGQLWEGWGKAWFQSQVNEYVMKAVVLPLEGYGFHNMLRYSSLSTHWQAPDWESNPPHYV